jgi:HSP20 family protein
MKLIRYNYPEFTDLFSDFDRFFRSSFNGLPALGRLPSLADSLGKAGAPRLAADLYEDDENYYTRVELPGAKRKDVKVELEDSILTITYEHKSEEEEESEAVAYKRSLSVPEGIEGAKVSAALKDGILTVTLPRSGKKAPKKILID